MKINLDILFEEYEYSPGEAQQRFKKRRDEHIRRFRAAQERGDAYRIKFYDLQIKIDNLKEKELKLKNELTKLKKQFKK